MTAILDWLNEYESALSAIAALIVIGTVAATVGRQWLTKRGTTPSSPATPGTTGGPHSSQSASAAPGPVTDRPSIAVLPFENTSGDPAKEAVARDLPEEKARLAAFGDELLHDFKMAREKL